MSGTRRWFLRRAGLGAALLGGAASTPAGSSAATPGRPGAQPHGLPERQFAWNDTLRRDTYANPIPPRFDRLLFFDVRARRRTQAAAVTLEAALRTLERAFRWGPEGLLFTVAWGPHYFEHVLGVPTPIPHPAYLSGFEEPVLDGYDMCLHLACDDERRLAAVQDALIDGRHLPGADAPLVVSGVLRWRETRTGFNGAGLPARHQQVAGIPAGHPIPARAPLFMGFKSGLGRNQASEDAITIPDGRFAGATTMHVSHLGLNLQNWFERMTEAQRVQRMYAAQATPAEVADISNTSPSHADQFTDAISSGVVGHAQTTAQVRRNGQPIILRRDFNSIDGDHAGTHFVALQRSIEDFVATRQAMNAVTAMELNPSITYSAHNGINAFLRVHRRANYLVPARRDRSFPHA